MGSWRAHLFCFINGGGHGAFVCLSKSVIYSDLRCEADVETVSKNQFCLSPEKIIVVSLV